MAIAGRGGASSFREQPPRDRELPLGREEERDECCALTCRPGTTRTPEWVPNRDSESGGYYSYDLGSWHLVALNSNCVDVGGCDAASPQGRWLENDLADDRRKCTLAYFHYPLFSSGKYAPGIPDVKPLWETLYSAGADVVLNGHDHNYQRFAPQDPEGESDPERGIREFVVGTGGESHYAVERHIANLQTYNDDTFGVLRLTPHPSSYDWKFVPVAGETFADSGTASCH